MSTGAADAPSMTLGNLTITWVLDSSGEMMSVFQLDEGAGDLRTGQIVSALEMTKFQILVGTLLQEGEGE